MTSDKRRAALEIDLGLLEVTFKERLVEELRGCAAGHTGLFGANDAALIAHFGKHSARYLSSAAEELLELGAEIDALRERLGYTEPDPWVASFKSYRRKSTHPNAPGERKLALQFLQGLLPDGR